MRSAKFLRFDPCIHRILFTACLTGAPIVFMAGCGGSSGPTLSGNTAVTVLVSSNANDQLSFLEVEFESISLTNQAGQSVSLENSYLSPDFIHINGLAEPLVTATVPQGVYTSATVTLGSGIFSCVTDQPSGGIESSTFQNGQLSSTTVTFPTPITVTGTSMGLLFNLNVSQSATASSCGASFGTGFSITPVFSVSPVTIATNPTNTANGKVTGMHGLVSSVGENGSSLTVTGADSVNSSSPTWQLNANASTVIQGLSNLSDLAAGMPIDMDAAIQQDGSLLATRIAVYDTDTTDLNVFTGVVIQDYLSPARVNVEPQEQQGSLNVFDVGYLGFSNPASTVFQVSGALSNLQNLPFTASFTPVNIVSGQNVSVTYHVAALAGVPDAATVTLMPQTIDGTTTAIATDGDFTVYTVQLAPYDLFPLLAVQSGANNLLTDPDIIQVYADGNTQMPSGNSTSVGAVSRFYGLVFNDNGTLRMDCAQINDGVEE